MIASILLIYLGVQISAPWWFYALCGFRLIVDFINLGIKLGKNQEK